MLDHGRETIWLQGWNWAKCEYVTGDQITGQEEETLYKDQKCPEIESPVMWATEYLLELRDDDDGYYYYYCCYRCEISLLEL